MAGHRSTLPEADGHFKPHSVAGGLVQGGYELASGDWTLAGDAGFVRELEPDEGSGPQVAVVIRFGI